MRVGIEKLGAVNAIMQHEEVYPFITDDFSPEVDDFLLGAVLAEPKVYVLMPNEGSAFLFTPHNAILYEVHVAVLPKFRGKGTAKVSREVFDWMFINTKCRKIIGFIPEYNSRAIDWANRAGMSREGKTTKAFLKNGKLIDLVLFGTEKEI